ncbi:MAG: hypothetical protein AAF267_01410 [Deinococcota bacterium]
MTCKPRYLARWRADCIALALWRAFHGLRQWESQPLKPGDVGNRHTNERQTGSANVPALLTIRVEPVSEVDIPDHSIRLWRTDYEAARASMTDRERNALDTWLLRERYTAVFGLHRTDRRIRRLLDEDTAEAMMKIQDFVDVVAPVVA